jgi:type I site-specific restriction endonuclease
MEKEYDKDDIDFGAIEGDFFGFLKEKDWDSCNAIIDNLRDMKEYEKGLEFCRSLCKARMMNNRLPSDYENEGKKEGKKRLVAQLEENNGLEVW